MFLHFKRKSFTLIEMVMVLVIVGLLMAIITGQYLNQPLEQKIAKTKAGLEKLRTAIALYYAKEGVYPMSSNISSLLVPYLNPIPNEGFDNSNSIVYGMSLCGQQVFGSPGGWCYSGDGHGGKIFPNLPNNDANYGNQDFSKY